MMLTCEQIAGIVLIVGILAVLIWNFIDIQGYLSFKGKLGKRKVYGILSKKKTK